MPWYRRFWRMVVLSFFLLLLILCLEVFDEDTKLDHVRRKKLGICAPASSDLYNGGDSEFQKVILKQARRKLSVDKELAVQKASYQIQHESFQEFNLATSDRGFADFDQPGLPKQSDLQPSANSWLLEFHRNHAQLPSVLSRSSYDSSLHSSFIDFSGRSPSIPLVTFQAHSLEVADSSSQRALVLSSFSPYPVLHHVPHPLTQPLEPPLLMSEEVPNKFPERSARNLSEVSSPVPHEVANSFPSTDLAGSPSFSPWSSQAPASQFVGDSPQAISLHPSTSPPHVFYEPTESPSHLSKPPLQFPVPASEVSGSPQTILVPPYAAEPRASFFADPPVFSSEPPLPFLALPPSTIPESSASNASPSQVHPVNHPLPTTPSPVTSPPTVQHGSSQRIHLLSPAPFSTVAPTVMPDISAGSGSPSQMQPFFPPLPTLSSAPTLSAVPSFPSKSPQSSHRLDSDTPAGLVMPPSQLSYNAPRSIQIPVVRSLLPPAPATDKSPFTPPQGGNIQYSWSPSVHPHSGSPTPLTDMTGKAKSPHGGLLNPPSAFPFPAIVPSASPVVSPNYQSVISPSLQIIPGTPWRMGQPYPSQDSPPGVTPASEQHLPLSHRRHHHTPHLAAFAPSRGLPPIASSALPHSPWYMHARAPVEISPGYAPVPITARQTTPRTPLAWSPMILPSPPPNLGCVNVPCSVPYTETPIGSPCGCVLPIQSEVELGVALYALFPLISVLAEEIADSTLLSQSQVRIMGANADNSDQDKSIVSIDLVPMGEAFDNLTALIIFQKFWNHEVFINTTLFGNYTVIYVRYPGLPPSPPVSSRGSPGANMGSSEQPLGVNIMKRNDKLSDGTIAIIALSSALAVVICLGAIWVILLRWTHYTRNPLSVEPAQTSSVPRKRSGGCSILSSDIASSTSLSFASSMTNYVYSARTFTFAELEIATDKFKPGNIVGEGGFGRVYSGILDDGTKVAVKVLTRDDQHGGREFVAEVEMLSRLHHRNLVKLIGICTEEHNRCLVYELVPNGSLESHLHGVDKETAPLYWDARMKIALGAARGLAYLHEDSIPRVIHRDFKASNILLESDFTPKVSDFGLAKAAPDEGSGHISTRVMGTFGYVAPEYAMTGHLLVKSDVYSYGVVLLELLSGRKPVDMSQPPGQENLVTWARPLLTSKEGLEMLVDPALGKNFPFDNMARVAAVASMCVQPEVSHRPFMGEVVQALKLVYNDVSNGIASVSGSQGGETPCYESGIKFAQPWHNYRPDHALDSTSFISIVCEAGPIHAGDCETDRPLSASTLLSNSGRFIRQLSDSFRRHSTSGPLTGREASEWFRVKRKKWESASECAPTRHFGTRFDRIL